MANTFDKSKFYQWAEDNFGTDQAMGVLFQLPDDTLLTAAAYDERQAELADTDIISMFEDGSSAVCCTNYAIRVGRSLPAGQVTVFGFYNRDNPTSRVAREVLHPGGHDFAVVHHRFIVDPWLRLVAGEPGPIVFDMLDPEESKIALDIYGPTICWTHMDVLGS